MRSWSLGAPGSGSPNGTTAGRSASTASRSGPDRAAGGDIQGAEKLGQSWEDAFHEWVEEHKRYPEQAIANMEDGTNQVTITMTRDGHVQDVSIEQRSGSQWLDLGTLSLFRGRTLPAFPPDTKENEITIQFTMHYIIVR